MVGWLAHSGSEPFNCSAYVVCSYLPTFQYILTQWYNTAICTAAQIVHYFVSKSCSAELATACT